MALEAIPTLNKFGVPTGDSTTGTGILMPKLKYRFRVTFFEGFGGAVAGDNLVLTQNVQSVVRPKITHEEVIIDSYNSRAYIQGKHTWEAITVTVRDDMTNGTSKAIGRQLQRQFNHFQQTTPAAGSDYKFQTAIEVLDGTSTEATEYWVLEGCFLTNVDYSEQDYSATDPVQIVMTIKYDNATQYDTDSSPLSPAPSAGTVSTNRA